MSLRHFRRHINEKLNQNITSTMEEVNPTKEVCLQALSTNPLLPNIETHNIEIPVGLSCKNMMNFNYTSQLELPPLTNNSVNLEENNNNNIQCDNVSNFENKIQKWVLQYNVSRNCVNDLLGILRSEGFELPKDVRTLMKTPKKHDVIDLDPGKYIHFGLEKMLIHLLTYFQNNISNLVEINIDFNIDGLPLAKSSKQQFWPILCSVLNLPKISDSVFAVGIYYDTHCKPSSIEEFLNPFINELLNLLNSGITVSNNKTYKIKINQIICDAPAKAFLLNVKGHNSRFGCNTCCEEGSYLENRMAFTGVHSSLRTDTSFRIKSDDEYHKGVSPLERLPIDIIQTVCLDYMHVVCLGVMKRLLKFWVLGSQQVRMLKTNLDICNSELIKLREYFPSEFSRLPRSLNDILFWKATEFRMFLLYTGPIILKGRIKKNVYQHFMKLHCAIKILVTPNICIEYNNVAQKLIIEFVNEYADYYGQHFMTYNVHSLIHLSYYVQIHGCLDNFSAFKFENYLGQLKKSIKHSRYPLQEAANRIIENMNIMYNVNNKTSSQISYILGKESENNLNFSISNPGITCYESITILNANYKLCINAPKNNYVMLLNNQVACIKQIIYKHNDAKVLLSVCTFKSSAYFKFTAISSDILGSVIIDLSSQSDSIEISLDKIKYKCFCIEMSDNATVFTLSHNITS